MKKEKNKDLILVGVLIVITAVVLFISSLPTEGNFVKLSYKEYTSNDFDADDTYVYIGDDETEINRLSALAEEYNQKVYYIDNLTDKQKEEFKIDSSIIEIYENGELSYTYEDGNYMHYDIINKLMDNGTLEKALITINSDEYVEAIKNDGYNFIFIGQKTCSHCVNFKETLKSVIPNYVGKVSFYYIDVASLTSEQMQTIYATDTYFSENQWGTPLNFLYKDGKRIAVLSGERDAKATSEFLKENGIK